MRPTSTTDRICLAIGRGLLAGLAGTAAMTLSQTIEQKINDRSASTTPADGVSAATGITPADDDAKQRMNTAAHWAYGSGWGLARGALDVLGLRGPTASLAHATAVLGSEQVLTPALGLGRPTPAYGASAVAVDALHHLIYGGVAGAVYDALAHHPPGRAT